jgi:predicted RecB family nuclease
LLLDVLRLIEVTPMPYPTSDLDGITQEQIKLLRSVGIRTTEKLLEAAHSMRSRKRLSVDTGISEKLLLRWANMADRMRIKGIGEDHARLLEAVGVVTVRELKYRNPAHIAKAMRAYNDKRKLVRLLPNENAIKRWIAAAGKLDQKITY